MKQFSNNVAIKPSKMLAYRNPSNEDSDSIFNYTLKLDAYDISTALKLARKYLIRKDSNKKLNIISLIAKHVHAVKTELRQFDRPLRGIGAIHFGYR